MDNMFIDIHAHAPEASAHTCPVLRPGAAYPALRDKAGIEKLGIWSQQAAENSSAGIRRYGTEYELVVSKKHFVQKSAS